MRSRKSPLEYYRTLGVQPGASRKELRIAFLRLVKECHPDKFAQNPQAQSVAQEKLKAINEAYSCLRDYRPDGIYEVWTYPEGSTAQWREYRRRTNYEPPITDPYEGDYQYRPVGGSRKGVKFAYMFAAVVLLSTLRYVVYPPTSGMAERKVANTHRPTEMQVVFLGEESRGDWVSSSRLVPYFFRGSTKSDVYRVQGIPDWSSEREWRYGDSRVYFEGDGVQQWKSGTHTPLKVIELGNSPGGNVIAMGSTPRDVLAIQGAPDSVTDSYWQGPGRKVTKTRVWHYGSSKIEFSDDKVVSWESAPNSALRVQR